MSQLVQALLIEPDARRCAAVVAALAQATIKVSIVDSLSSSLLRFELDRFDCVITAQALPEGSGPALIQRIRRQLPPVPLVVLGEASNESAELMALGAGADEYLSWRAVKRHEGLARAVRRAIARDGADERRRADHQAERAAALSQVAAAVAHQVNNPVAFIASNNAVLRSYVDDLAEAVEDLAQAVDAEWLDAWDARYQVADTLIDARQICVDNAQGLKRVGSVVTDLGTITRCAEETPRYVDLNAVLERAYWAIEPRLRERARVDWQLAPLPQVLAEARQLESVFTHLIRNAMQALEPVDAHDHRVTIRTGMDGDQVMVTISDTGCGLPTEARSRVFEPFFSTREPGDGAGLGLAVCDQVVARHGGQVELESRGARGTHCRLRLPRPSRAPADLSRAAATVHTPTWATLAGEPAPTEPAVSAAPRPTPPQRHARSSRA